MYACAFVFGDIYMYTCVHIYVNMYMCVLYACICISLNISSSVCMVLGVWMLNVFRAGHLISNNQLMCFYLWKTILVSEFFMNLRDLKKGCVGMLRETKRKKGEIVSLHDNLKK